VTTAAGTRVVFTRKEFEILATLVSAFPKGLSATEIRKKVWGDMRVVSKAFDVHLFRIRRKLGLVGYSVHYEADERYLVRKD